MQNKTWNFKSKIQIEQISMSPFAQSASADKLYERAGVLWKWFGRARLMHCHLSADDSGAHLHVKWLAARAVLRRDCCCCASGQRVADLCAVARTHTLMFSTLCLQQAAERVHRPSAISFGFIMAAARFMTVHWPFSAVKLTEMSHAASITPLSHVCKRAFISFICTRRTEWVSLCWRPRRVWP
jgi:hypothetical protein